MTTHAKASGVDAIYYSVRDVAKAIAFYKGLLNIESETVLGEHGAEWVLADGTAFGIGAYSSGEHKPSGCVLFRVDDVEAIASRVAELGGRLIDGVRDFPACRAQWCEDVDGNSFVLHQRTA